MAWRGEPILVSMGSLAHYMQETSTNGLAIRHFIHEGIGEIWYEALKSPKRHAAFVLVEEKAEGGDQLFRMAQKDPAFLDGFTRTCEGGGVALYVGRYGPLSERSHRAAAVDACEASLPT